MARVLVSFIGKGQIPRVADVNQAVSRSGYKKAVYTFPAEDGFPVEEMESTIFGSLLLKRLERIGRPVDRWLIMGTDGSIWADLEGIFPQPSDDLLDIWQELDSAGKDQQITPEVLHKWQQVLTAEMRTTTVFCRLVGYTHTLESQRKVYAALLEAVGEGDEIILDVTHGFRHQPLLASFMVMLLRWLREVKRIDIYNGALELGGMVLKLDSCSEILQMTEAVATYRITGNFVTLAKCLGLGTDFERNVAQADFLAEMNQPTTDLANEVRGIRHALATHQDSFDERQTSLSELLGEAVSWANQPDFAQKLARKADTAFAHGQFFKAIALLWEGILVAGCKKYHISNPQLHSSRALAEAQLYDELAGDDKKTMQRIERLRNSILHGTRKTDKEVNNALKDRAAFAVLFQQGHRLLRRIQS